MPFEAKAYRVLIASPGDVGDERLVIPEVINEWNAVSAFRAKSILMPVRWETHTYPAMGDRPQAIINEQIVKDCDLLVGIFWTRIGTQTGVSVSGTAEEIEQFVAQKKPVMLYFSQTPVDPEKLDIDQFKVMREFRDKMRRSGLTESYAGTADFRQKFVRQLSFNVDNLLSLAQKPTRPASRPSSDAKAGPAALSPSAAFLGKEAIATRDQVSDYVVKAIQSTAAEDGWANIAAVGQYLSTYTPIKYKLLGYETLKSFLVSTKLVELKAEKKSPRAQTLDSASVRLIVK
ncbi:OST-HTH/LOTUS domain-containing protein [Rhodoferax sp.]|uniref:OST-HTH/LOTUS domain-containing protein n=1 Tax=Rhodoferax sp. TaxID=50421 RepID=UPI00262FB703|nr:OST-HTH/LOTUS domain-containing protein [Rhodoferax sp.]MDD2917480.1 OST-HTH/LOTUS domain-containing protein [Rhodoferax sp.]